MAAKGKAAKRMTLRVGGRQREDLERLKAATGEATASKAIWRAVATWPQLRDSLRQAESDLDRMRAAVRGLAEAEAHAEAAAGRVQDRRRALLEQADNPAGRAT